MRKSKRRTRLPHEIIDIICSHADYFAYFGLACASKRLHDIMYERADEIIEASTRRISLSCDGAIFAANILPNGTYHTRVKLVVWKSYIDIAFYRGHPLTYRAGPVGTRLPAARCVGKDWERLEKKFSDVVNAILSGGLKLHHPFDF